VKLLHGESQIQIHLFNGGAIPNIPKCFPNRTCIPMWGDVAAMWWRILGLERWTEEMMELRIGQNMSQIQPCWEEINRSWIQMFSPQRLRMPRHTKLLCGVKCASPDASGPKFGSQEPMIKSSHWVFFFLALTLYFLGCCGVVLHSLAANQPSRNHPWVPKHTKKTISFILYPWQNLLDGL